MKSLTPHECNAPTAAAPVVSRREIGRGSESAIRRSALVLA